MGQGAGPATGATHGASLVANVAPVHAALRRHQTCV
jgi:hypothetical protein